MEQPLWAPFFGLIGCSASMILCALGAGYGTAMSGIGISCVAVSRPENVMKSIVPVVMSGIVAVYGLVVSVMISQRVQSQYTLEKSIYDLGSGLSVGFSGLSAGYAIGVVGDAGVRATSKQPRMFVGMVLILIFAEVLGLYGMIVALILSSK